jgi:hypothetical protein
MRRYSLTTRKLILAAVTTLVASLGVATTAAQAVVLNDNASGNNTEAGVSLTPSTRGFQLPNNVSTVNDLADCVDPWLSSDLGGPTMPTDGLCYRNGSVIHKNETFALTWDTPLTRPTYANSPWAVKNFPSQTEGYVERFLRDTADASGSLGSPFAVTTQFHDAGGQAQNASVFGGGCIDNGHTAGSACASLGYSGAGYDFPTTNQCDLGRGNSFFATDAVLENVECLTEAQIQTELSTMIAQTGIIGRTQPGYTPLVDLLLPPGVVSCLDVNGVLCSANNYPTPPPPTVTTSATGGNMPAGTYQVELTYDTSNPYGQSVPSGSQWVTTASGTSTITIEPPPAAAADQNVTGWFAYITGPNGFQFTRVQASHSDFNTPVTISSFSDVHGGTPPQLTAYCSYHSQVNVGGTEVSYVVQPWTAGTSCDEPGLPTIAQDPPPDVLDKAFGARLVSPLSQAEISAIVNPALNGWAGPLGSETEDNQGCSPLPRSLDKVTLGSSSQNPYYLQREWNNGAALDSDPNTYGCAPGVVLTPDFVVPSSVDQGDVVQFDGRASASTLVIPKQGYAWNFGDGTTATGPSVVHSYAKGGDYTVTLTVTDRGGNVDKLSQVIRVLGGNGQAVPGLPTTTGGGGGAGSGSGAVLNVHLQMLPQSLKSVLRRGIAVRVSSNRAANGVATVWITRAAARRAHIKTGKAAAVRIGLGTVSSVTNGTITLRLHLSPKLAKELRHLRHVTMTVRLALVASGNQRLSIDAAGRY